MIEGLRPYGDYQNPIAPWFGKIPAHWQVKRLGSLFVERGETNERREVTDILSVMKDRGVIPYAEKGRIGNKASDDIGRYKIVRPDDLVVNCMNVIIGSLGRSSYTGCLSPVYYVFRRRDTNNDPRYLAVLFRHKPFYESLIRIGNGILAHRMRVPMEKLKAELLPLPPPDEQLAIVKFLDYANGKIERAIRAKRKLITLLNEQKQAIIHRAVTRGLDPNVKLKPSGIPWLGDVPEHWEVKRVKDEFICLNNRRRPLSSPERGRMTTRIYDYYGASGIIDKVENFLFNETLLLIAEDGANLVLRNLPLLIIARGQYWVNNHAHILKPRRGNIEYLAGFLETLNFRPWITGAAQPKLTKDRLMGISICVASPDEQDQIIGYLVTETKPLRETISRLEKEVLLLREYRTTLTAEVVTGKLDVREAVKRLPAETEEPFPTDELLDDEIDDEIPEEVEA